MKNYLFLSAVGMMMFAACSDDKVPLEGPDGAQPGSEISLTLNSSGDGLESRAGRPVNSSEAANNVTAVKLYIYSPAGADVTATALAAGLQNPITWTAGPSDSAAPGTDQTHKATQTVRLNKLSSGDGVYTIVAYGYNNILDYTVTDGNKNDDSFSAALLVPGVTPESELFAGKATFTVVNGNIQTGTNNEVVLKRHVAGLLGYFKNVPVLYPNPIGGLPLPVAFVRVYASSYASSFTFPSVLTVNGTGNGTNTKVLEFNLLNILTAATYNAQVAAAGVNLAATFTLPALTGSTVTVPNSILSGKFLVPFAKVAGATTFTVQLESAAGIVLKKWDIVNNALTGDKKVYDVQRNYFYSIGQKYKASSTDGGTPGDTPGDDDNPIDLSQETVIQITVNDAWDTIYNLGIE